MKKILLTLAMSLVMAATTAFAHHPAADMVSDEVYEAIEDAVSLTPHAEMVFDDMETMEVEMAETKITTIYFKSLGTKTNKLVMLIFNYASMLDGDVEILIQYAEDGEELSTESNESTSGSTSTWSEWGRPFNLSIMQVLP